MTPSRLLLLSLLCPALAQAQAGDEPWYVGGSLGLTQVSNLYRVSSADTRNDDQLATASLLAGGQLRLGRQRLRLDTRVDQNQYRRSRDLDYLGFNGTLALDWQIGNNASGQLSAGSQRSLAPFSPGDRPNTREKNIQKQERARLSGRYGLFGPWSIEAGAGLLRSDYSQALYDPYDLSQRQFDAGVRWQGSPKLSVRLGGRHSNTDYPRASRDASGTALAESTRRNGLELAVDWQPSALHGLNARLGQGRTRYALASSRSESSTNGRLSWTWLPTARLRLQTSLSRDDGDDSRVSEVLPGLSVGSATNRRNTSLSLQAAYAITAKLTADASLFEYRRELVSSNTLVPSGFVGEDRTRSASLGLRWAFDRNGQFGCQWNEERRTGQAEFSTPYSARSIGCSVQYFLR